MEFLNRSQTRLICFLPFEEGAESIWDHDIEVIRTEFRQGVQCSFFCCGIDFIEKWSVTDRSSLFRLNKIISALSEKGSNFAEQILILFWFLLKNLYIFFLKKHCKYFTFICALVLLRTKSLTIVHFVQTNKKYISEQINLLYFSYILLTIDQTKRLPSCLVWLHVCCADD